MDRACDEFFADHKWTGLSYGDVRIEFGYTDIARSNVDITSRFSRNVGLKVPIVSAAMDTVTGYRLAIAVARAGGLGVLHKNMTIEDRVAQVQRVKRFFNVDTGLVEHPVTVHESQTVAQVYAMKARNDYPFGSFLVVDSDGKLKGVATEHDFKFFEKNPDAKMSQVKNPNLISINSEDKAEALRLMDAHRISVIPVIDGKGYVEGMFSYSDLSVTDAERAKYNTDANGHLRVGAALNTRPTVYDDAEKLIDAGVDVLVIDTSHGDTAWGIDAIKGLKDRFPDTDVIGGNISTTGAAERLASAGADGLKIGQGPGAICTTRIQMGVGCPQVTAIHRVAKIADNYDIPACADGGIEYSGDIVVAIGAGAHSVMVGSKLARTLEAPGEIIILDGVKWKKYRGMGSTEAMESAPDGTSRYAQEDEEIAPEGISGRVPYNDTPLEKVLSMDVQGLRGGLHYTGSRTIQKLRKNARFIRQTTASQRESHPGGGGVVQDKDEANYTRR